MRLLKFIGVGLALILGFKQSLLFAQSGAAKQAEKKMDQGSWAAARQVLVKSLRKDSLNPEIDISLAKWFLSQKNPNQQIDSAYKYSLRALSHFCKLTSKQKEKLSRDMIDSASLVLLRARIETISFDIAKQVNTEKSYNDYLDKYKFSIHKSAATELRDEVAYLDVLRQNSYAAFENYIIRYPQSLRLKEAKSRYEKLLYDFRTQDRKWKSYETFVKEFPQSPYKKEAERNVFKVLTSNGSPSDFIEFIEKHPHNSYTGLARDILFHLLRELDEKIPDLILTDSLKTVAELNRQILAPVYKNGKFGFIDSNGAEALSIRFESIDENYKCGSIETDILLTNAGLVSRSGKILSSARAFKDLGYGFIKVSDTCTNVIHKSGTVVSLCVDDAFVLAGRYLVVTKNGKMSLVALNGRELIQPAWHSIELLGEVLVLEDRGKKVLVTSAQLRAAAEKNPLDESFVFDEVKLLDKDRLLVRNGSLEGVVNSNLEFIVPLAMQQLLPTSLGLLRKINDQYIFADLAELKEERWDKYTLHQQWLQLKNTAGQKLFDTYSKKIIESNPDSLWFENRLAFTQRGDSLHIHINSLREVKVPVESKLVFIKSPDSVRYFFVQHKNKKTVFSVESGSKLYTTDVDQIESLTADYFVVYKKNKKGLVDTKGKIILPIEYDILLLQGNHVSLYKDKKFGLYNISTHQMVKPSFQKNLVVLDSSALIAFQNGRHGLIDWTGQPISEFEYDEIQPWVNGKIWVRKDYEWSLIDFQQSKKILTRIKNFQVFKNTPTEKLAIVKQENLFGVVSSTHGIIIPPSFTFLMNLGNTDEPFYFTSKDVEEAGIVVVIYYDKMGKLLRKQVYEDEEYGRIVCPQD